MPHFFFHVRTSGGALIVDRQGIAFPDIAAAVADATSAARETVTQGIATGEPPDFSAIEIVDAAGEIVATVPFKNKPAVKRKRAP